MNTFSLRHSITPSHLLTLLLILFGSWLPTVALAQQSNRERNLQLLTQGIELSDKKDYFNALVKFIAAENTLPGDTMAPILAASMGEQLSNKLTIKEHLERYVTNGGRNGHLYNSLIDLYTADKEYLKAQIVAEKGVAKWPFDQKLKQKAGQSYEAVKQTLIPPSTVQAKPSPNAGFNQVRLPASAPVFQKPILVEPVQPATLKPAQSVTAERYAQLVQQAIQFFKEDNYRGALDLAIEARAVMPLDTTAPFVAAMMAKRLGDTLELTQQYQAYVTNGGRNTEFYTELADLYLNQKNYGMALFVAGKGVLLQPTNKRLIDQSVRALRGDKKTNSSSSVSVELPNLPPAQSTSSKPVLPGGTKFLRRYALVVGNSNYQYGSSLDGIPVNDATDMATRLQSLGFTVTLLTNTKKAEFEANIGQFNQQLKNADVALFFYAGHGIEAESHNYLIPTDAKLTEPDDADLYAVDVQKLIDRMRRNNQTTFNIIILDACRDNPFKGFSRGGSRGFKQVNGITGESNMYLALATDWGNVAENGSGRNGVYTGALLNHLRAGEVLDDILLRTQIEVRKQTKNRQSPQLVTQPAQETKLTF